MRTVTQNISSRRLIGIASALVLSLGCAASGLATAAERNSDFEEVTSFSMIGGLDNFYALDRETLLVWTNPNRPYLIELAIPCFDLEFTHRIGIRANSDRVYAGFDAVIVRGTGYTIKRIYRLTREDAEILKAEHKAARAG
jgi:hypothetical protein